MKCSKFSLHKPKGEILIKLPKHEAAKWKAFIKTTFSIFVCYPVFIVQTLILYNMYYIFYIYIKSLLGVRALGLSALQTLPYVIFMNKYLTTLSSLKDENAPTARPWAE